MRTRVNTRARLLTCTALMLAGASPAAAQDVAQDGFLNMLGRLVFGAGSERVAIDVPQAVTVLEEEEIERSQPATVGDIIENVPGIAVVGTESPWGQSFNIRGIGSGASADEPRIVMVIDGVSKYYEQYRVGSLFAAPDFFRRVEVLRGPSSSTLYGAGAVAGVISLETRDASDYLEPGDNFAFDQTLQYSDNGNGVLSTSVLAFRPNDQFSAVLGYSFRESDQLEDGSGAALLGTEGILRTSFVNLGFNFGDDRSHSLELSYLNTSSFVNDQVYDLVENVNGVVSTVDRDLDDTTAYLRYSFDPVDNDLIDLQVQYSYSLSRLIHSDARETLFGPPPPGYRPFAPFAGDYGYESVALSVENQAEWHGANWDNYLTVGISGSRQFRSALGNTTANLTSHPEGRMDVISLYAQNEFVLNDRFTVIAGTRIDSARATSGSLTGFAGEDDFETNAYNLALHYQFNENFSLFGSASYTERAPVLDELFSNRFGGIIPGNPGLAPAFGTLEPEESVNFELGAAFSFDDVIQGGDSLSLKTVIFQNTIDQEIDGTPFSFFGPPPPPGTVSYTNLGEIRYEGIEIEASYSSDTWYGSLAYSRTIGEDLADPTALNANLENRIPADSVVLGLGYRTPNGAWDLGWSGTWSASAERYLSFGPTTTTVRSESYLVHDVYAVYRPQMGLFAGTEVRLGIENVGDEQYRTHLQSTGTARAGRTATLTISRTF